MYIFDKQGNKVGKEATLPTPPTVI